MKQDFTEEYGRWDQQRANPIALEEGDDEYDDEIERYILQELDGHREIAVCVMQADNLSHQCSGEVTMGAPAWVIPGDEVVPMRGEPDWNEVEEDTMTMDNGSTATNTLLGDTAAGDESDLDLDGFEMLSMEAVGYTTEEAAAMQAASTSPANGGQPSSGS